MLLVLVVVKCLCSACSPDYMETLTEAAKEQAQAEYERHIGGEVEGPDRGSGQSYEGRI